MLTADRRTVTIFHVVSYLYSEGKINLHTNLDLTPGPKRKALYCAEKAPTWARLGGPMQDLRISSGGKRRGECTHKNRM